MTETAKKKIITPTPQFFRQKKGVLQAARFNLSTQTDISYPNKELLNTIIPICDKPNKQNKNLLISSLKTEDSNMRRSGAYSLRTGLWGITISIHDQEGLFYALKTLQQLVNRADDIVTAPVVEINDFPDVCCRGTVEGFYGIPWSFKDRISQLNFYGNLKLNTYIYGPKDDPYHSSPNWRNPYPDDKATEITELIEVAGKNYVDFVWAIHPGRDIRWTDDDRENMLKKFGWMYDLGVRSFAVFFDDITGEGTDAEKQAGLLNYLYVQFVKIHDDVKSLTMCPTEYNKSWANPEKGSYLDILGEKLNSEIRVLWTGSRVISNIDKETTTWVNQRLKRQVFYWWNFPVNDYVRDHLLMGPAYGNTKNICNEISGFVCNPMEWAEASKIGIFGVADYTWNMSRYDSERAFANAIHYIAPEVEDNLLLFAENNSDLGPNGHGYRRKESEKIRPVIRQLKTELASDYDKNTMEKAIVYFQNMAGAASNIISNANNRNLVTEIKPWLDQFALLGKAGTAVLTAIKNYEDDFTEINWNNYLTVRRILLEIEKINKTQNINPYQPGIKTGSLVLTPFVQFAFNLLGNRVIGNTLVQKKRKGVRGHIISNIIQLEAQNVQVSNESISISPYLESITLKPGSFIGLRWPEDRTAISLHYNFNIREINKWGAFEVSPNGKDWVLYNVVLKEQSGDLPLKPYLYFVRFINNTENVHHIYLNEFTVKTKMNNVRRDITVTRDQNSGTYMTVPAGGHVKLSVENNRPVQLFMELFRQPVRIYNLCNPDIYSGKNNYVKIPAEKMKKCGEITLLNKGKKSIQLFEIV